MPLRFLHLADPHIDSPMKGLRQFADAPVEQLRSATRDAFAAAMTYAIDEAIPLVVIAGDLFDNAWEDIATGLWVVEQFIRLRDAGVKVCLIRGNHDAASLLPTRLRWPENVHEFTADGADTWIDEDLGVAVHGQSFADRSVPEDLAALYPSRRSGLFNIGLLHTSLTGSAAHDTYAPTSLDVLYDRGYDYWALGHIHKREQFDGPVPVAFAGNMQGRSVRETGPRGGLLVEIDGAAPTLSFVPFDAVRWNVARVDAERDDATDDLIAKAVSAVGGLRSDAGGRPVAVRLQLAGVTGAHHEIAAADGLDRFEAECRSALLRWPDVWVEKIRLATRPPVDVEAIRGDAGVLAMLLDACRPEAAAEEVDAASLFEPLRRKLTKAGITPDECGIEFGSQMRDWTEAAEAILLATLSQTEG